ncbi:hypothetical protein ScPMuIL_007486 [Solemya velum]
MSVKILPRPEDCYGPSYSMYVWTKGFDNAVPGSDSIFMDWDTGNETYFNHTWDTHEKRQWMWATCCRTGRRIGEVYLSGTHDILKTAYKLNNPAYAGMDIVRQTVREGHEQVPGLNIFALYAASDLPVTEQKQVRYVVWYNDVCAVNGAERFDGFAVNNEAYSQIKNADNATQAAYLDNLMNIVVAARKQVHGHLPVHYSIGWHWGQREGSPNIIHWQRKSQQSTMHMIDIFDSVDVQVGWTSFPLITQRMKMAGYDYAVQKGKPIYVTVYTDKPKEPNRLLSFFPLSRGHSPLHSESGMFAVFDKFSSEGIPAAKPCIHYFRGVYSSGGHPDWPAFKPS